MLTWWSLIGFLWLKPAQHSGVYKYTFAAIILFRPLPGTAAPPPLRSSREWVRPEAGRLLCCRSRVLIFIDAKICTSTENCCCCLSKLWRILRHCFPCVKWQCSCVLRQPWGEADHGCLQAGKGANELGECGVSDTVRVYFFGFSKAYTGKAIMEMKKQERDNRVKETFLKRRSRE